MVDCVSSVGDRAGHFTGFWARGGGLSASATPVPGVVLVSCTWDVDKALWMEDPLRNSPVFLFTTRLLAGPNSSRTRSSTVSWCR